MNRKSVSASAKVLLVTGALVINQAPCAFATYSGEMTQRGGQAPGSAAGGSGFSVRVGSGLDQGAADSMKQDLVKEGFTTAEVKSNGSAFDVVIPGLASKQQADGIVNDLKNSGYTTSVEIVSEGESTVSAASGGTVFRVLVSEFDSQAEADEAVASLVNEGFVNGDVVHEGSKYLVLLNTFNNESDAQGMLDDVKKTGFSLAKVVNREKSGSGATGSANVDLSGLPAAEQQKTREVLAIADKVASGQASADEVKDLRREIQQLSDAQKNIIRGSEGARTAEQSRLQKIFPLYREFDKNIKSKNYDQAEKILAQVREINPNDIFLPERVAVLARERSGGSAAPGARTGSADPAEVQKLLNEARTAERGGNKNDALTKYNAVLAIDPGNTEARGKVFELQATPSSQASAPASSAGMDDSKKKLLMYGGGGLLALVILGLIISKLRGKKAAAEPITTSASTFGSEYDPLASPSTASYDPTPNLGSPVGGMDISAVPTITMDEEESAPAYKAPTPAPIPAAPESETVSLDAFEETVAMTPPPVEEAPVSFDAEETIIAPNLDDETVSLSFNEEPTIIMPEESAPESAGGRSAMDADLEALLKGTFPGAETEADQEVNMGNQILSGLGAAAGATEATPMEEAPAAPSSRVVFEQSFEGDSAGSTPGDWTGEYDYASLTVVEADDPAHGQCLAFQKGEGIGSATYHLSFPPASGNVSVEFDLRCDEKNKFLLGVYFEKDEDFKQSIHTIIHQLDPSSPASLRIQGEATPYAMGSWVKLRYDIDLNAGILNASVDGEPVVNGLALPTAPEYVNSISIRDNLATTGTLYLDNIRVMEA